MFDNNSPPHPLYQSSFTVYTYTDNSSAAAAFAACSDSSNQPSLSIVVDTTSSTPRTLRAFFIFTFLVDLLYIYIYNLR